MAEIIIRKYTDSDEVALRNVFKDANRDYVEDFLESPLKDDDKSPMYVAEYDGVVAGYLHARFQRGNNPVFIYVAPEYRRRGIGSALYDEAERQVREKGENEIYSHLYSEHEIANPFAVKQGFSFTSGSTYMICDKCLLPEIKRDMIRKYRDADVERVHQIVARGFHALKIKLGYPDYLLELNDELDDDRKKEYAELAKDSWVLEDENGKVVGFGCCDDKNIGSLAVDLEEVNKGYGKALSIFMTHEIFRRGGGPAELWCEVGNDNARHIYKAIGYKEVESAYTSFKRL